MAGTQGWGSKLNAANLGFLAKYQFDTKKVLNDFFILALERRKHLCAVDRREKNHYYCFSL